MDEYVILYIKVPDRFEAKLTIVAKRVDGIVCVRPYEDEVFLEKVEDFICGGNSRLVRV